MGASRLPARRRDDRPAHLLDLVRLAARLSLHPLRGLRGIPMTSLRKLNRWLLAWERFAGRYLGAKVLPGHTRAVNAVLTAQLRRHAFGGWFDERHDERCCLIDVTGHHGPCVMRCEACRGTGLCPDCGGLDDLGCDTCGGSGGCPEMCDAGKVVAL
jgi:hypothetical protein